MSAASKHPNANRPTRRSFAPAPSLEFPRLQCSVQRVDDDRVLLQCGSGFIVTDNKGAGNMLKGLASILEVSASSAVSDSESWCRTPRLVALDAAFASLSSQPARKPSPRQCPRRTQNKCQFRRQPNYVCLFSVASNPKIVRSVVRSNVELSRSRRGLGAGEAGEQRISHRDREQEGRRLSAPVKS